MSCASRCGRNAVGIALEANTDSGDGKNVLEAQVKEYELYCYQGRAINPSAYLQRGFDTSSVCGATVAATVAATIMGLNED